MEFLQKVAAGKMNIAGFTLAFEPPQGCRFTQLPADNYWMEQAGYVYELRIHQQVNIQPQERLAARGAPYYPDAYEAARDWLGIREYHGSSDSSHGHLLVMIPESRAYISEARWSEDELTLKVEGSLAKEPGLTVLGAYWIGKQMHQLASPVDDGQAKHVVPQQADRLELAIVGVHDEVFDTHREDVSFTTRGLRILAKRRERIAQASDLRDIYAGEGVRTEFKEYLELTNEKMPNEEKGKLAEVLRTVAAFANTEGGTIYFGVSDAIEIVGTDDAVAKLARKPVNEASIYVYMGTLRQRLLDFMYPGVTLRTRALSHKGKLIIALDVDKSERPVCTTNDRMTYTRVGSNNMKTPAADLTPATASPF